MKAIKINKNLKLLGRFRDEDSTEKFVFDSPRGIIELTWVRNKKGISVFCLPTHHYCNLGCKFCHLTEEHEGIDKKMIPIKAEDLSVALDYVMANYVKDKKILLSFMGVGEPFLNLDLIFKMFDLNKHKKGFVFGYALATMMLTPTGFKKIYQRIKQDDIPIKIHFSLHSPIDKIRHSIIPSSRDTISQCLKQLKKYQIIVKNKKEITNNLSKFHKTTDPVEIHYAIIKDINDSENDLIKLINIGKEYEIPLKILKFNPTESLERSRQEQNWIKRLKAEYGASFAYYAPPGPNIGSSCGQFTKHYYLGSHSKEQLKEFNKWKLQYEVR